MADAKPTQPADPAEFPLPLAEFCARLSATDKRVELLSAFAHSETKAGRLKDVQSAYGRRFAAFVKQPA